jgi:cytochrome c biogenesis protein CcmG, thiol:disulfide interchange protein DsbE
MTVLPQLERQLADAVRAARARPRPTSRRRRTRRVALALAATLAVSATALAATQPWTSLDDAVDHGARPPAPDRSLPILGRPGTASLAQFRGRIIVLSFYASWCVPCREQAPLLEQAGEALADAGAGTALLVDDADDPGAASAFVAARGLDMPVVSDADGLLARDYDVQGLPETFVIDRAGRVVAISRQLVTSAFLDDAIAKAGQASPPDGG